MTMISIRMGLLLSSLSVSAAIGQTAEPWPAAECEALARAVRKATHINVSTSVETFKHSDFPGSGASAGKACVVKGETTGLDQEYAHVYDRARAISKGWKEITDAAGDGPASSDWGFRKGRRALFVSLASEPPASCGDEPVGSCVAPLKLWTWTVKATAYKY